MCSCLLMYKELFGDLDVPSNFVVPKEPIWPQELWDVELGKTLCRIKDNGEFAAHR